MIFNLRYILNIKIINKNINSNLNSINWANRTIFFALLFNLLNRFHFFSFSFIQYFFHLKILLLLFRYLFLRNLLWPITLLSFNLRFWDLDSSQISSQLKKHLINLIPGLCTSYITLHIHFESCFRVTFIIYYA